MLEVQYENYNTIFDFICDEYLESVKAIAKISPGLSTGLYDEKENIVLNTYNGKMSDIPNDENVTISAVFDASSMTKMFTSILLLKEEEKGNIDLNKKFSDYSSILQNIDVSIIDALRFGCELLTDGRIDEIGIPIEEVERRFKSTYIVDRNTFLYSDIPYMLVPLLFGNTMEEATENYLKKFYELFRDEIGLFKTGYSTINMTGGSVDVNIKDEDSSYSKIGFYDSKTNILEKGVGYISGHAGMTTTVIDLEKLFKSLSNGLLSKESLEKLVTTIQPDSKILLDKEGRPVLRNGKEVIINRGMGVYINTNSIRQCDIPERYSKTTFTSAGSTGTNSIFDLENGFNATYLSNIRSSLFSKTINTDNYTYGDDNDEMPKNYETTVLSGTHYFKGKYSSTDPKGSLIREDGSYMTYVRATNNFKEECLDTLLKLRIAKKVLVRKAQTQYSDSELENEIEKIELAFSSNRDIKIDMRKISI